MAAPHSRDVEERDVEEVVAGLEVTLLSAVQTMNGADWTLPPPGLFLKESRPAVPGTIDLPGVEDRDSFSAIRCPLCRWRPSASSRWYCEPRGTPEPFFHGCGTSWNTFATRGCCPGCGHHWQWTSCLHCGQWSRHEAWYEEESGGS